MRRNNHTDIIILTWNNLGYTKQCIRSIREHTDKDMYEIIVVDNNSTDGTVEWLKEQTDLKCIFNKTNNGFAKGNNQGIRIANGDSILLLNNDTIVTSNWLNNLRIALFSSEKIGAVGPLTNFAAYHQQINTPYPENDIGAMTEFAKRFNISDPSKWEEKLKLIGFCMMIKMNVVKKIGGLDEGFSPAHYEDDDYCFRILKEGYKLFLCKDTFVHHYGSKSVVTLSNYGLDSIYKGRDIFIEKWGFDSPSGLLRQTNIVNLIKEPIDKVMNILEVGCYCGETLLYFKNRFKNANLYGVEKNPNAAKIVATFANVISIDLDKEDLPFEENFFDIIYLGNTLGHFRDPLTILKILKLYLKSDGILIISSENIMNSEIIFNLIRGKWNNGNMNQNSIRFFTLDELNKLYIESGLKIKEMLHSNKIANSEFVDKLCGLQPELKWLYEAHTFYHTLCKESDEK